MFKRITLATCALLFTQISFADDKNVPTVAAMQTTLGAAIPEIQVETVRATPIPGIFEVTSGANVFYVTAKGDYLLYGELLSLQNNKITNLTENTRKDFVAKALAKIDPKTLIIFPATTEPVKATITIGTDVDCGYCRKLHEEVPALNAAGITVRYLAFPRTPQGTASYEKSAKIWCAKDPKQTIDNTFKGEAVTGSADCKHPLPEHKAFLQSIGASATPVIILENGTVLPGYMPAADLIKIIEEQK
jgi:thiol:disulfide interchange protein DsbC